MKQPIILPIDVIVVVTLRVGDVSRKARVGVDAPIRNRTREPTENALS
jgi:hypothetical protein